MATGVANSGRLPGHPLMWVLILSELAVFTLALCGFAVARLLDPATFHAGAAMLDPRVGAANTIVLVTSGLCAARALAAARLGRRRLARAWLAGAAALGLAFVAIKSGEYAEKFALGLTIDSDRFFTLYFLITGFHFAHVVAGIVVLALVAVPADSDTVETGAAFWHLVDLVWVLLFPVFYLVR